MKRFISITAIWSVLLIFSTSSAQSLIREIGGYTVIRAGAESIICLGKWVPSTEPGRPGVCEGQMVDGSQLTAISTKQTTEKLDQVLIFLESMDQKLAENNAQMERLIEATVNVNASINHTQESISQTMTSINQQTTQVGELMHDTISSRVDALSRRVLASDTFRKELEKLKQDILADLKKYSPAKQRQE